MAEKMSEGFCNIQEQARTAAKELLEQARLETGSLFVVGCSSSEVTGHKIGSDSSIEAARAVFAGIYPVLREQGVYLAAQCCEHLNRALIIEEEARRVYRLERVNVVPQPKAGGSFATTAWEQFVHPCAVEALPARAGMDIGGTLIGMHLVPVAVPVRLSVAKIGEAGLICARTRAKFVGGARARYQEELL